MRLAQYRAAKLEEDVALQKLRAFFGWSYDSIMPRRYAQAYWERHVADVWNDDFDANVELLRQLEPGWHEVRT
jgi:hypothetical protein